MDLNKAFGTNPDKETEGVWVDLDDGARIKLARAGSSNKAFTSYLQRLQRQHAVGVRKEVPESVAESLLIKAIARHVLRDWSGLTDGDAPLGAYTEELGVQVLTKFPELLKVVLGVSTDMQRFQDLEAEVDEKN